MNFNPTFSYFANDIKASSKLGDVTLQQMLRAISKPKPLMLEALQNVAYYSSINDEVNKNYWKTKLYSFTPAVSVFNRRAYNEIHKFTGLMPVDFDKLESPEFAQEFKHAFFDTFDCVVAAWLSSSKRGLRAIIRIPICQTTTEFKQYFEGFQIVAGRLKGFDSAPKNCVLPLFISYDPEILIREDFTTWTTRKIPEPPQPTGNWEWPQVDERKAFEKIKKAIDKIVDNGHPQLRAAAYTLGGYVSGGRVLESDAVKFIESLIDQNSYLCQKADVYKKTAQEMIKKGQEKPIYK